MNADASGSVHFLKLLECKVNIQNCPYVAKDCKQTKKSVPTSSLIIKIKSYLVKRKMSLYIARTCCVVSVAGFDRCAKLVAGSTNDKSVTNQCQEIVPNDMIG